MSGWRANLLKPGSVPNRAFPRHVRRRIASRPGNGLSGNDVKPSWQGDTMARRSTIKDVAREAGVSVTTVDRALNGRLTVREDTMRKIAEAAHRVGYHARGLIAYRLETAVPQMRFGFVLLKRTQEFFQNFAQEIERAVAQRTDIRGQAVIRFASSQSPDEFASLLVDLGKSCDAVACVAVNHHRLDQAVQDLKARGVPVFALLNDFAQGIRRNYLGLNNMKVGRQAAWMVTRTARAAGPLAIFIGGNRWHGHDLRETGFRAYLRETAPQLEVLETMVNLETRQLTYEAALALLARHDDLRGLYVAGGGMEGAIAALGETGRAGAVSLVVSALTPLSRKALAEGVVTLVTDTPLEKLCRTLFARMAQIARMGDEAPGESQHFLPPDIHLRESL